MANYGLTFTVDAPYLLEEGANVDDFPVLVKIPIANAANLFGTGETGDTVYFESEGEILKHECVGIEADYAYFWVKCDLETTSKKIITLHYGALVDNNYSDKRGVWVNGISIYHLYSDATDTMGIQNGVPSGSVAFGSSYGINYPGCHIPAGQSIALANVLTVPYTLIFIGNLTGNTYFYGNNVVYTETTFQSTTTGTGLYQTLAYNSIVSGSADNKPCATGVLYGVSRFVNGNNICVVGDNKKQTVTYAGTLPYTQTSTHIGLAGIKIQISPTYRVLTSAKMYLSEVLMFSDAKSSYWMTALARMYNNLNAYVEIGNQVDLDALTDIEEIPVDCVANINKQLGIYDIDFRNIMYEVGDFNATWRLPGTEGITIWGIYQPRPVGDYFFPEMDNVGINDALFFTVTDYMVDIHDKIDIEGVRFDLQAIQVHPIADQKIYKMCVLKRQPEYYATCKGSVS